MQIKSFFDGQQSRRRGVLSLLRTRHRTPLELIRSGLSPARRPAAKPQEPLTKGYFTTWSLRFKPELAFHFETSLTQLRLCQSPAQIACLPFANPFLTILRPP